MDQRNEATDRAVERRRAGRSDTRGLVLELHWVERSAGVARLLGRRGRTDRVLVKVVDLSLGGARIEVPGAVDLRIGQIVELAADEDCRARAAIRYVSRTESRMVAGLEFTTVHNPAISAFFDRLLSPVEMLGLRWDDMPLREEPTAVNTLGAEASSWTRDDKPEGA